jgi:hypothetical protein
MTIERGFTVLGHPAPQRTVHDKADEGRQRSRRSALVKHNTKVVLKQTCQNHQSVAIYNIAIRVDKRTQAVKLVCQTLLHAKVRTGIPHKKNDDDRTELPIIQLKSCKKYIADPCVCVCVSKISP